MSGLCDAGSVSQRRIAEVPVLGRPLAVRGRPDLAVLLEDFTPTHIDAWTARAVFPAGQAAGRPSRPPVGLSGDPDGAVVARAVVVRHGGDVSRRTPRLGRRRRRLDALLTAQPPGEPLVAVVIEEGGSHLLWVTGEPADVARRLSAPGWRAAVDPPPGASVP